MALALCEWVLLPSAGWGTTLPVALWELSQYGVRVTAAEEGPGGLGPPSG